MTVHALILRDGLLGAYYQVQQLKCVYMMLILWHI